MDPGLEHGRKTSDEDTSAFGAEAGIRAVVYAAIAVMFVIAIFNGLLTSGSAKAMALMPILIPLADIIGMTRQTMILAFQFGDGLTNSLWFTSGTLLIFLTIAGIPLKKWWKFITPLISILFVVCVIALIVATKINYGPF